VHRLDEEEIIRNSPLISLAGINEDSEATRRIGGKLPGWKNLDSILQLNLPPELLLSLFFSSWKQRPCF